MGLRSREAEPLAEAGELLAVEAIDRSGVLVTSEGALVRALEATPKNPLVLSGEGREQVAAAFGRLVNRLSPGQWLQFYVDAAPVHLHALIADGRAQSERAVAAALSGGGPKAAERVSALRALADAHEEALCLHALEQAAIRLRCYVIVPYLPDQHAQALDWSALIPGRARQPGHAGLRRDLAAHRQVLRESLVHTDAIRSDLEALDMSVAMLDGAAFTQLIWRRFNPTSADRDPDAAPTRLEVLGALDEAQDAQAAAQAAVALREAIAESPVEFARRDVRVDRDLEHVLVANSIAEQTEFGWLLGAMQIARPYTLSVYVHARDRLADKNRQRSRHKRIHGVNRGSELRGRPVDFEMSAQEEEAAALVGELSGYEGQRVYDVAIYQSVRERGPVPDERALNEAVGQAKAAIAQVSDVRAHLGDHLQQPLWLSSLPLGRDVARRTCPYVTRNVGDTVPLIGTGCGSPTGIPFAQADPGRTLEHFNPYDPAHDNHTLVVFGKGGGGKTFAVIQLMLRMLAFGASGYVIDRADHYEFATRLIPGAQHISIGSSADQHAVNPWDTPDPSKVPLEKLNYLLALHALLIANPSARDEHTDITQLERSRLDLAIRHVYTHAAHAGGAPRESDLHALLLARSAGESDATVASVDRSLAERLTSYVGEGAYAYLLDRPTTVHTDAPLVVFDTRSVPDDLTGAVTFILAEHITGQVQRRNQRGLDVDLGGAESAEREALEDAGSLLGKSFLITDETWSMVARDATGWWINDLSRRSRHHKLCLIAITQQLSDFTGRWGKALLSNSTMQLFVRQSPDELRHVQDALRLTDAEVALISRLKTAKRHYSQAYWINGTRGRGTVTLRVGPTLYWAATSDPVRDVPERQRALRAHDDDAWAALRALAANPLNA